MTRDGAEGPREIRTDHREGEIAEKRRPKRKKWIGNESVMGPRGRLFKRGARSREERLHRANSEGLQLLDKQQQGHCMS